MRKNDILTSIIICEFLLLSFSVSYTQDWIPNSDPSSFNLLEFEKNIQKDNQYSKLKQSKFIQRWIEHQKSDIDINGHLLPKIKLADMKRVFKQGNNAHDVNHTWFEIGPTLPPQNGIGRVNDIESHPTEPNRFYAAAPSGGIWMSDDQCQSWYSTTDKLGHVGVTEIEINRLTLTIYLSPQEMMMAIAPNPMA